MADKCMCCAAANADDLFKLICDRIIRQQCINMSNQSRVFCNTCRSNHNIVQISKKIYLKKPDFRTKCVLGDYMVPISNDKLLTKVKHNISAAKTRCEIKDKKIIYNKANAELVMNMLKTENDLNLRKPRFKCDFVV